MKQLKPIFFIAMTACVLFGCNGSSNSQPYTPSYSDPSCNVQESTSVADYSWIVGIWYVETPYGTTSICFDGDGKNGKCTELLDASNPASVQYGYYEVENDMIKYKLSGEPVTTTIEIHPGNKLYFGSGYYYKKIR